MGSVEVRLHSNSNLMRPIIIKKATEGDIIGFSEGDGNVSASPLTWFISMQNNTEVIYIDQHDWTELWNL
jgi:hypothetical protein